MTVWYENTSVTLLTTNWIDPEGDTISVRKIGLTAATVANIDWVANGGVHSITVNGFGFKVYESGLVTYDDAGVVITHPTTGINYIGKIYYTMWDGFLESAVAYTKLRVNGNVTADVVGPIPVSTNPSNGSASIAIDTSPEIIFDEPLVANTGTITVSVNGGATIQTFAVPGDIGGTLTLSGSKVIINPTASFANNTAITIAATAGTFKDAVNNTSSVLTAGTHVFTTIPSTPPTSQPLPAPTQDVWHFDDAAIDTGSLWNTSTTASTWATLMTAIQTAMADVGTVPSPKYHTISYTGAAITGSQTVSFAATQPTKGTVYIRVKPSVSKQTITGMITVNTGLSDVMWVDWRFQPDRAGGVLLQCFKVNITNRRIAWRNCDFGVYWRGITTPGDYPEVLSGGSTSMQRIEAYFKNCNMRSVYQGIDGIVGKYHMEDVYITGLVDDVSAMTVRNASPNETYLYKARVVAVDYANHAASAALHPDGTQTGEASDAAGDRYIIEEYQCIIIGDTTSQYPTHGLFAQRGGPAQNFLVTASDNFYAILGWRAVELSDKRADLQRIMGVWPPTAIPIPTTGTGWTGGPAKPQLWLKANTSPGQASTPVIKDLILDAIADTAGWGTTPTGKYLQARPAVAHGIVNDQAYDRVFRSMTGMTYSGGQTRIDPVASGYTAALVAGTADAIRAWIEAAYVPTSPTYGTGWVNNGLTLPTTWKA